jgi:hypothetical protein
MNWEPAGLDKISDPAILEVVTVGARTALARGFAFYDDMRQINLSRFGAERGLSGPRSGPEFPV